MNLKKRLQPLIDRLFRRTSRQRPLLNTDLTPVTLTPRFRFPIRSQAEKADSAQQSVLVAVISAGASAAFLTMPCAAEEPRMNEIQVIGSHNSYHRSPPPAVLAVIGTFRTDAVEAWDYTHPPLTQQLAKSGLRQFELDVYADPAGGLFADPLGVKLARLSGAKLPPFDPGGLLRKPGFKILHVPDVDCWSNNPSLESALTELRTWSIANPTHLPLMILIECEDTAHPPLPTRPVTITRDRLLELETAILAVLPKERILRPDDVRKNETTLRDAVARHGWPTLAETRGKFLFALDNTDVIRDRYLEGSPSLEGRVLFVSAPDENHPAAAWFKCNDPVRSFDTIQKLVRRGFLVRTRADEGKPAPAMRDRAFASGAQWISTDRFSAATPADTRVGFENGAMVRPNPINGGNYPTIAP